MVDATAFNSSYIKNPYLFHHYNLSSISLYMYDESVPTQPLKTRFSTGNFMEAYQTIFSESFEHRTFNISRHEYESMFALFTFRIAPDEHFYYSTPLGRGNVKISGNFESPLPHNVTLIILATFPSIMHIGKTRNVKI